MSTIPQYPEAVQATTKHYGVTEKELDFFINYDIKSRIRGELAAGE